MSKLYDLLSAMCGKIKKPDWNQNDPTAPDYVKNRPFWTDDPKETVLFDGTVENDGNVPVELINGQEYTVTLDGVEYVLTAQEDDEGYVYIGSESLWWEEDYVDSEPPFVYGDGWFYTVNDGDTHTFTVVSTLAEIHKIESKYLPDTVATMMKYGAIPVVSANAVCFGEIIPFGGNIIQTLEVSEEQWIEAYRIARAAGDQSVLCVYDGNMVKCYPFSDSAISLVKDEAYVAPDGVVVATHKCIISYDSNTRLVTAELNSEQRIIK